MSRTSLCDDSHPLPHAVRFAAVLVMTGLAAMLTLAPARAQTPPPNGMRPADLRAHAITNATVIIKPGEKLENATIIIRNGAIEAVGHSADIAVPADARIWPGDGLTVYPGLIEPALLVQPTDPPPSQGDHWNARIRPQRRMADQAVPDAAARTALRKLGFTAAAVYANSGALRGSGVVVALADENPNVLAYKRTAAMAAAFEFGRGGGGGEGGSRYPGSLMGSVALLRQTLYDAQWHAECRAMYERQPAGHEPPVRSDALAALDDIINGRQPVLFDTSNEHAVLRAARLADEFTLKMHILGSGVEFRRLDQVVATKLPLIVPLNYPRRPEVSTPGQADAVSLRDLMTWEQAPTNARRLINAGAEIALTTAKLRNQSEFHGNLHQAIRAGLTEDQALAALTTTPAKLLELDSILGTIEPGKVANLVVVDGSLFAKSPKIRDTWINGRRYEITAQPVTKLIGEGEITTSLEGVGPYKVEFDTEKKSLSIELPPAPAAPDVAPAEPPANADADAGNAAKAEEKKESKPTKVAAKKVVVQQDQVSAVIDGKPFKVEGYVQLTGVIQGQMITGRGILPDGSSFTFTITQTEKKEGEGAEDGEKPADAEPADDAAAAKPAADAVSGTWSMRFTNMPDDFAAVVTLTLEKDNSVTGDVRFMDMQLPVNDGRFDPATGALTYTVTGPDGDPGSVTATIKGDSMSGQVIAPGFNGDFTGTRAGRAGGEAASSDKEKEEAPYEMPPEQLVLPLGGYGRSEAPEQQDVLITNATIWTCGPQGVIDNGWMLVTKGKIASLGAGSAPAAPSGTIVIDATGKHVTPGLIDCHSHTGCEGSVNEFTESNTCEVRIADVINPDDIDWYRELAGGLTAANQLHGSANVIGGQNSVVKLKWGHPDGAAALSIRDAIPGVKFALGENVKQTDGRYPATRMGVETWLRDAFTAASEYKDRFARYNALPDDARSRTMPPRRDLELDCLVEILDGKRLVHCHSYRQDEILMLIRVAEDFGFTIGTFQHVLEGYKVAEAIAKHGAGGSTFSDWWAYKMEVMDAIPYNGSLMSEVGVVMSFNSDSDELARRMNTEAAKAVRYGGVEPVEALKFVTINPAKQLRIDHRTGSLEPGKDADFVIWSGDPLSTYTRCEQTWIEGACYFSLEQDAAMRAFNRAEHNRLIQKVLSETHGKPGDKNKSREGAQGDRPGQPDGAAPPRRGRRPTLLANMFDREIARLEEQVRRGKDPAEVVAGDCGCADTLINRLFSSY